MIVSSLIGYSQQKQEAKQALSEIQSQYSNLAESLTKPQGLPKQINPINTIPKTGGQFGEMEKFIKEFMAQMVLDRNDYMLGLKAIGWNRILDSNRIKADKSFVESKAMIKKAKEIVIKYTNKTQILLRNTRKNIRSLNISESSKRTMLAGFDNGMEKTKGNIDAMWSMESKIINEFENIITLLSAKKGAWHIDGGHILFYNDSDLVRYNSYIASIQSIGKQQEVMQRQSIQTVNRKLDRMKNSL